MKRTLAATGAVFVISYGVAYFLGEACARLPHPWRHITQSGFIALAIGVIFHIWKRVERNYFVKIETYAKVRKKWVHELRHHLQLLMFKVENDVEAKELIRKIDVMLDEPLLEHINGKYTKEIPNECVG